ncbi:MAG: hypothetical protein ACKOHG_13100 [Planctomycetia bacterium]
MPIMTTTAPLARLLSSLDSSLAMYVADAGIWSYPGDEEIKLAIADFVGDQRSIMERAGTILEESGEATPRHAYPIQFTATHDLDLKSLLPRIIAGARRQVAELDAVIAAGGDPAAIDLVREAQATTHRHADILAQLGSRPQAAAS